MASRAVVIFVNVFVAGSKISGTSARHVKQVCAPEVIRARPSGSVVEVGYQRRYAMFGNADQDSVTGSKMLALAAPMVFGS